MLWASECCAQISHERSRCHKLIGALINRDWPFGIFAQSQAGDAKIGRLLLNAA